jgi:hypothetical protein
MQELMAQQNEIMR